MRLSETSIMLKKYFIPASIILSVFLLACEPPEDSVIAAVNDTNALLNRHVWKLEEFTLKVRNEDIPPPLLFKSSGATLEARLYDLENTVLDASEMKKYEVEFNEEQISLIKIKQQLKNHYRADE